MTIFRTAVLLLSCALLCFPQSPSSAGGRWYRIQSTDIKAGSPIVTFELEADTDLYNRHPTISLTCSDRSKSPVVLYHADTIIDTQIHDPLNYYANALYALIKVDKEKLYRAVWDIQGGESPRLTKTLLMDRKTTRKLLTGSQLKVRFEGHLGQEFIDTFTIEGLDKELVRDACGSKWFGKE